MGCIVNGPGESKHADIGISLPGTGETPAAPVFIDGKKAVTLRGPTVAADFKQMVIDYIETAVWRGGAGQADGGGVSLLENARGPALAVCHEPASLVRDNARPNAAGG